MGCSMRRSSTTGNPLRSASANVPSRSCWPAGEGDTAWFSRHGSTPITEIPGHWPTDYRDLVQWRIEAIESVDAIRLLEAPEFKRRWASLARAHSLGEVTLVHKKGLDSSRQGFDLADDVRLAIADVERYRLVGCVLNTIDDALDRTDPGGTDWTAETVKHLGPLLRAAMTAGRLVVLTSDHGHVVERRRGTQRGTGLGARYRAVNGSIEADEVLVNGPRVLAPDHQVVLAVNERLRYGPLKAGYHGGATPAEAIVPVALLAPSTLKHKLTVAPVPEPKWWETATLSSGNAGRVHGGDGASSTQLEPAPEAKAAARQPDLAEEPEPLPSGGQSAVGATLVASAAYRAQRELVGRLGIDDEAIAALVDALATAPDRRLSASRAASVTGVPANRVPLVMSQVAKLLNVEGYPVVSSDPATQAVRLDAELLAEQYGVQVRLC